MGNLLWVFQKYALIYVADISIVMAIFRWLNLELDPTLRIPFVSRYLSTVIFGDVPVGEICARGYPEYPQQLALAGQA